MRRIRFLIDLFCPACIFLSSPGLLLPLITSVLRQTPSPLTANHPPALKMRAPAHAPFKTQAKADSCVEARPQPLQVQLTRVHPPERLALPLKGKPGSFSDVTFQPFLLGGTWGMSAGSPSNTLS